MRPGNWKDIAELLGIAAIVASLVFVGLELQQSQRIAYAEQEGAQIADFMAIDELMRSNADLISRLNREEELTGAEKASARSLVGTLHRSHFFINRRAVYLEHPSIGVPLMSLAILLFENQGLRELWEEENESAAVYFAAMSRDSTGVREQSVQLVKDHLAALDRMGDPTPRESPE